MQGIREFSLMDTPFANDAALAKFSLQYAATLYNYSLKGRGGFYGRTYMSEPKPLTQSGGNMLESKDEEFIFLHTNYPEKTTVMVVEIVITRELNFSKVQCSGGFAVCPIFEFGQQSKTAVVQSGTPRSIGALDSDKAIN